MKEETKNILWVDDEIDQLKSQIFFLEQRNYKVTPAQNGDDAIELVKKQEFDLILLDEMMPGRGGLATLEEIKKISPNPPVIMVTKSEEESLMEEAIGQKIAFYITKPVNPSQILSAAKKLLEEKKIIGEKVVRDYVTEFRNIQIMLQSGPSWQDWIEIHKQLSGWEIEMEGVRDRSLIDSHRGQKRECDSEFGKAVEKSYLSWINSKNGPPLSPQVVKKYLFPLLQAQKQVYFIVLDCMRLDHWYALQPILTELFNIQTDYYFSILPTATPYARNAIFSGLFPDELAQKFPEYWNTKDDSDASRNRNERQLLDAQLKRLGLTFKSEPKYVKVLDLAEAENLARKISTYANTPLLSIVVNFLDILAHGRSESEILLEIAPDEAAFRSLMKTWFSHSPLLETLRYLAKQDCVVVFTTDHGSVLGTRGNLAYGKRDTSTHLRYKYGDNLNCDPKGAILIKDPKQYRLPMYTLATTYIFAKEDYYFVYPTNYHEYEREYRNSFQHGGISLEEMVLPVAIMRPR
ncbi:MAG: response regulator [candidate division Zixibacteria bacterium RBG_16_50_21]|nr:MAG: response regulator [candidate division Zixibacteria bacterium RBG_16_50_21]